MKYRLFKNFNYFCSSLRIRGTMIFLVFPGYAHNPDYQDRGGPIASDHWSRQGYVQIGLLSVPGFSQGDNGIAESRETARVPCALPPRQRSRVQPREAVFRPSESVRFTFLSSGSSLRRGARKGRRATTRRGQLENLWHYNYRCYSRWILHVSSVPRTRGTYSAMSSDAVWHMTRATKIDSRFLHKHSIP